MTNDATAPTQTRSRRVLSVGQCGFDNQSIAAFLKRSFGVETAFADTTKTAIGAVREGSFALVLVNRVFDLDGSSGLELVRALKGAAEPKVSGVPVMLVSNYADARRQAEELGAIPGFGKADLQAPEAELIARLKSLLG